MATTSIWSIKGWLGKLVIYVENPEKTEQPKEAGVENYFSEEKEKMSEQDTQSLSDVIAYAVNAEKTEQEKSASDISDEKEEIMQQYVSGVNCSPMTAREEMIAVKKRFGKNEGIMAFHGYQSFAPGECTPVTAHEIGVKLAEELWGERFQVIVATHLDKAHHLHNHFVVNSVSFKDGLRYHRSKKDYQDMRNLSDKLCREYGLSVIEKPEKKSKHYGEWRAEKEGRPTYLGMIKEDVDEAIRQARTEKQFFHYLKEKGYSIKIGKDVTLRAEGRERGMKLARNLGEDYTMEMIRKRILAEENRKREIRENEAEAPQERNRQKKYSIKYHGNFNHLKKRKIGGLRGLYLHYCFLLGILPRNQPDTKKVHLIFREDLLKLNTISKETRLLCRYRIDTVEQLFSLKENFAKEEKELTEQRKHLRYQSRSIKDGEKLKEVKEKIAGLTGQIKERREGVVLCDGIAARSGVIKEKMEKVRQEKREEEKSHEHIWRSR